MARQEQSLAEQKVAGTGQKFSFLEAAQPQAGSQARSSQLRSATLGSRDSSYTLQKMDTNKSLSWGRNSLGSWGRTAGRFSIGHGSTRRKELKEILLQTNSPGSTLRFATTQKTSNSSNLLAGLHQEQKSEQSPDLLPLVLDPLEHAWLLTVAEGDAESIIKLLDLDPSLLTRRDFVTGFTALHWLAKHGHHESLIQVISHAQKKGYPVNVNIPTASGGLTPLHLAALQGHEVLIKVLVGAYGADTSCRDHNGRKAWQYLRADTSRDLKELAGALEEDLVQLRSHNTNNNCKSSKEARAGQDSVDSGAEGKAQHPWSLSALRGIVRQAFAFFQEH
ncbi:ankyrin repeat domain-containing protein SOWAHD [Manacus vitellinus]|uniref:ankyrin repeat domain-containing protein SOWAHD n=1 Tax=Manacus vitellinus TaxID=328815 RepID=UPI0008468B29|nr:ankyrin repeat domain-containing protein SOWAHD [Manacus vitellinus]XP_051644697.1 ankyrin repeat domain-containing protein SOWAHD [Manacus candei]